MKPFDLSFYTLKTILSDLNVEIVFGTYRIEKDGFNDYVIEMLAEEDKDLVEDRYEVKIRGVFYKYFLEDITASFNEFNEEIRHNLKSITLRESMPLYLEFLSNELKEWFNNIIVQEVKIGEETRWMYLPKNIDNGFLKSEGLNGTIIDSLISLFLFIKNQILKTLENIETISRNELGQKEIEIPDDLFTDVQNTLGTIETLDIYQTALLFYYLKKHHAINPLTANSLAKLVSGLTGHSYQNIRTEKGFGAIGHILSDITKNQNFKDFPNHNLVVLKSFFQEIIKDIDTQSKKNHPELTIK